MVRVVGVAGLGRSEWVGREIEHWVRTRGVGRLLAVVTDGTWVWDDAAGDLDFSRSTAAHPALRGVFGEEPRHVDLSWARTDTDLTLRNARFRDLVAEVAAPLHGRSKDDLEGEDVRQQRRTRRLVRGAVGALAVLAVLASVGGVSAAVNAREAGRQRDAARDQTCLAAAANLADQSAAADRSDLSLKILLAIHGGLALSLDETRVAWAASDDYDATTGERLSHRQCISMADAFRPSATAYVGGTDSPVYWDIGFGAGFSAGLASSAGVPGSDCAPDESNQNIGTTPVGDRHRLRGTRGRGLVPGRARRRPAPGRRDERTRHHGALRRLQHPHRPRDRRAAGRRLPRGWSEPDRLRVGRLPAGWGPRGDLRRLASSRRREPVPVPRRMSIAAELRARSCRVVVGVALLAG